MSGSVVILRGLDSSLCGTSEEAKFSLLYFSLCAEKRGKCSDLLLFYVAVGTFKKRCSFNEFASVHRVYILKRAI